MKNITKKVRFKEPNKSEKDRKSHLEGRDHNLLHPGYLPQGNNRLTKKGSRHPQLRTKTIAGALFSAKKTKKLIIKAEGITKNPKKQPRKSIFSKSPQHYKKRRRPEELENQQNKPKRRPFTTNPKTLNLDRVAPGKRSSRDQPQPPLKRGSKGNNRRPRLMDYRTKFKTRADKSRKKGFLN